MADPLTEANRSARGRLSPHEMDLASLTKSGETRIRLHEANKRALQAAASSARDTINDDVRQDPKRRPPGLKWWPPQANLCLRRSDLCTPCSAINFEGAFAAPKDGESEYEPKKYYHEQKTRSFTQIERNSRGVEWPVNPNCQFCQYLASAVYRGPGKESYTVKFWVHEFNLDQLLICVALSGFPDGSDYFPPAPYTMEFAPYTMEFASDTMVPASDRFICHRNMPLRRAGAPQFVLPFYDGSLAKSWFQKCKFKHTGCGLEDHTPIPKTKLIDCNTRKLVSTESFEERPEFVALSYAWGDCHSEEAETPTNKLPTNELPTTLPLTIEDAMIVTKDIGFRYLWVDQYCIDQRDEEDKKRQIRHMDLIYKCAHLTIIAAAGNDCGYGLPGVSVRRRDVLDPFIVGNLTFGMSKDEDNEYAKKGAWHTRAWTFQEALLSRRRLIFSETALYYECKGRTDGPWQSELRGEIELANGEDPFSKSIRTDKVANTTTLESKVSSQVELCDAYDVESGIPKHFLESFVTYLDLVIQYTARNLKYDSDALDAFRGAAIALQSFEPPVYSISGIPFLVRDEAKLEDGSIVTSLIETSFLCGLAWHSDAGGKVTPDPKFPSWSWANSRVWNVTWDYWQGCDSTSYEDHLEHRQILSKPIKNAYDMHIEFDLNGNKELHALAEYAKACRNLTEPGRIHETPTALYFKCRILNSRFTSEKCLDYPRSLRGSACSDLGDGNVTIDVHLDASSAVHDSQPSCSASLSDERLCEKLRSHACDLVLLHCASAQVSVLLVEWLKDEPDGQQRTARRIGICLFPTITRFLDCFSIEVDLRLV